MSLGLPQTHWPWPFPQQVDATGMMIGIRGALLRFVRVLIVEQDWEEWLFRFEGMDYGLVLCRSRSASQVTKNKVL